MLLPLLLACRDAAAPAQASAAAAEVAPVQAVEWKPSEELTGSLDPVASVQLGFDVPGRIDTLRVHRGDTVQAGDAIARLDARMAEAQLAQAEAALTGARAQVAAGEAAWARMQKLKDAGGVSEQQLTDTDAALQAGRAGVEQAEAAVRLARTYVSNHTLRAPIAGVVTNGPDSAGAMVGGGTPLFLLEDLSALQVKTTAPESASWIAEGLDVTVVTADGSTAPGKVARVIPALDLATRRIPVEIRVDAPPAGLRAHAFVRVRVEGPPRAAWSVPARALVARPDFCVFVDEKRVPVTVLAQGDARSPDSWATVDGPLADTSVRLDPPKAWK